MTRVTRARGLRITPRDREILMTLHRYDGILSVDQIDRWFFSDFRWAQRRISLLHQHGLIARPAPHERYQFPEPVIWLAQAGAELVASQEDVPFSEFRWRKAPRISKVVHDLRLNEFRHAFEVAAGHQPDFLLEYWYGQDACVGLFPKKTQYITPFGQSQDRLVQPDGLLSLLFHRQKTRRMRFCVEFDNGTESNVRFGRDKCAPGLAFVHSEQFQQVLHTSVPARWLVIVHGPDLRFTHLRAEVTAAGGAEFFLFTRRERVTVETVLSGQIWQLPHINRYCSLDEYETDIFQDDLRESAQNLTKPSFITLQEEQ